MMPFSLWALIQVVGAISQAHITAARVVSRLRMDTLKFTNGKAPRQFTRSGISLLRCRLTLSAAMWITNGIRNAPATRSFVKELNPFMEGRTPGSLKLSFHFDNNPARSRSRQDG